MYLLDTNVISELRKPRPHRAVAGWVENLSDDNIFLSAVTLGELQAGVEITRRQDPGKAAEIEIWLNRVASSYQILPADTRVFREWARLMDARSDRDIEDALIAATARVHGLIVATRNVKDFERLGVKVLNPFDIRPS